MIANGVDNTVREILETALGVALKPPDDPSRHQTERWDSLMHLEIVFMLEEQFGVRFSAEEIVALDSLSGIVSVLRDKNVM
jgi:acyl carrier protein